MRVKLRNYMFEIQDGYSGNGWSSMLTTDLAVLAKRQQDKPTSCQLRFLRLKRQNKLLFCEEARRSEKH